jgi:hypothetical protein
MLRRRTTKLGALIASVCVVVVLTPGTAGAAGTVYPTWTLAGTAPNQTGTMTVPATGFPAATFAATSNTVTNPSGASAFLGPGTPFGAVFGSSQGQPYLNVPAAPGGVPSTMTFSFATPTPPTGWGFTLGDVDADIVAIAASGPGGPLTAAQLGFQGAFNYCASAPVPSSCVSPPFTDVPTWDPATSQLVGNVVDTNGASGWFRPTAPITTLTFTFTVQSGIPIYQIWFASLTSDVSGTVTATDDGTPVPVPPGTTLELRNADGTPVLDGAGNPVTAMPAPDGTYAFPGVAATAYDIAVIPPAGFDVVGPAALGADATPGDVTAVDFALQQAPPVTTTTTTTTTPPTPPPTSTPPGPSPAGPPDPGAGTPTTSGNRPRGTLPATGTTAGEQALGGLALAGLGVALGVASRRLRATLR